MPRSLDAVDDELILSDNAKAAAQAVRNARPAVVYAHGNPTIARQLKKAATPPVLGPHKQSGNPNIKKGAIIRNRQSYQEWLDENPDYRRISAFKSKEITAAFLDDIPKYANPQGKRRFQLILEALFTRACDAKSPLQAQCAQILMNRAWGKEQASNADLEAIKKGGLTVVYINRDQIDPEIPVITLEADQKALPEPEFIDAEVVDGIN